MIIGTEHGDRIHGRQGDDCIFGLDGNDELRGFRGADTIYGGLGDDLLFGNQDEDVLIGQAGSDTYEGGQGDFDVCESLGGDLSFSRCETVDARETPLIVAAGDMACSVSSNGFAEGFGGGQGCVDGFVAGIAETLTPTAFLALGDFQSGAGDPLNWQQAYDKSWGRLYDVTYPTRGDGESSSPAQQAYASYFGSRFDTLRSQAINIDGDITQGSYSVEIGDWHILNIDIRSDPDWLDADLSAANKDCKLAVIHMPATSSGSNFDGDQYLRDGVGVPWEVLNRYKAAAVLSGDDHHYERFQPQRVIPAIPAQADGETWEAVTADQGAVQFVVGTGGQNQRGLPNQHPNTALDENGARVASNQFTGFLELDLKPDQATYRFIGYTPTPSDNSDRVPISSYTTEYLGFDIHSPVGFEIRDSGTIDCNTDQNTAWSWLTNGRGPFSTLQVGAVYTMDLLGLGFDGESDLITFRATGLPPGLTLNESIISGPPIEPGTYRVNLTARDSGTGIPITTSIDLEVLANSDADAGNGSSSDDDPLNDGRSDSGSDEEPLNNGRTR